MLRLLRKLLTLFWKTSDVKPVAQNPSSDYPDSFFRGVQSINDVDANYYLKSSAFLFGSQVRSEDGMRELSIIWDDCDDALDKLLNQKNKNGTGYQFEPGYATVQLSRFTSTVVNHIQGGMVSYERSPIIGDKEKGIESNPYHGNILLHETASDQMKKNIQHTLATLATFSKR